MISGKTVLGFLVIVCGLYATDAEPGRPMCILQVQKFFVKTQDVAMKLSFEKYQC